MSDQFRKFNQSSSQVSLHDVQTLQQMFKRPQSESAILADEKTDVVVVLPDFTASGQTNHVRPQPKAQPIPENKSVKPKIENSVADMDAIVGDPTTDILAGLTRSEFDLRTNVDRRNTSKGPGFQLQEIPSETPTFSTASVSPPINRSNNKPHSSTSPKFSGTQPTNERDKAPVCLGLAVATTFAESEPQLIRRIIARQENLGSQILLFADVDTPERVASVCVQIALEFAAAKSLRILVVDADATDQTLTRLISQTAESGWRECLQGEARLTDHTLPTERSGIGFLPAGVRNIDFSTLKANAPSGTEQLVSDFRHEYDLICVSLGTAFSSSLAWWGKTCDLSFLSLNPISTGRSLARLAVQELQQNGARLEGCIISYSESI